MRASPYADIRGFTLIEMMIVIAIAGILAMAAIFTMSSGASKVRGAAFRLRGDLNLARSEAVNRNLPVLVEFVTSAPQGYRICLSDTDGDASNGVDGDDDCGDASDIMIRSVTFASGVFYYQNAAGGPTVEADADGGAWTANTDTDGIRLGNDNDNTDDADNFLRFRSDGIPSVAGTIYLYSSTAAGGAIGYGPFAVDLSSVGRAKIFRWNNGQWRTR